MLKQYSVLVKSISLPFTLKVLTALIGLIFNYASTQYVSPHEFGLFSLAQLIILVLVTLSKFGLDTNMVKVIANQKNINTSEYFCALILIFGFLVIISTIFFSIGPFFVNNIILKPSLSELLLYIIAITIPNAVIALNSSFLRGAAQANYSLLFNGLVTMSLATLFIFIFEPSNAVSLLKLTLVANVISCTISFIVCFATAKTITPPSISKAPKMLRSGYSLWIVALVTLTIQQASVLFLARYTDASTIGVYAIATKIAFMLSFFLIAVNSVYSAKFVWLYKQGQKQKLTLLFFRLQKLLVTIAAIVTIVLMASSNMILVMFGENYVEGSQWLIILLIGQFINLSTGCSVNLLIMTGHELQHRNNTLIIALLTVVLAVILIPSYQATGAALTTSLAMISQNLLSYYFVHRLVLRN